MKNRILAILLTLTMVISASPIIGIYANAAADTDALVDAIESAKPLIYKGAGEQSRKYLADRIDRAEALLYDSSASQESIDAAASAVKTASEAIAPMHSFELIAQNGIDVITPDNISAMTECVGTAALDTVNKPEDADVSVFVSEDSGKAVFSNAVGNAVIGTSPFGIECAKADGIKLWFGVDGPAVFTVAIGVKGGVSHTHTLTDIHVSETGYVWLPFDRFVSDDGADIPKDGSLNYLCVEGNGSFRIAGLSLYNEILESANVVEYSETKITTRGQIEDNAYYKIIEPTSGKAITITPEVKETSYTWRSDYVVVNDDRVELKLDKKADGDSKQLWQLSPSPSGNGSFRLINKSCSHAIQIAASGNAAEHKMVDLNNNLQEWNISISAGKATLQVKAVGKLTTAGDTVKATTATSFKKFEIYKVVDNEYTESWSDEFDGDKLDRNKWVNDDGFYAGGGISSIHVDEEGKNLKVEDGMLNLYGRVERYGAWEAPATYMSTSGKFAMSYGRIDIRAKLACGEGQFPALWLMPADMMNMGAGEIDIMEMNVEGDDDKCGVQIGTIHYTTEDGYTHYNKCMQLPIFGYGENNLGDDFHVYSVEMDCDQVRFYFDGMQYSSLLINDQAKKFAFGDMPRYIIINNSLRGLEGEGAFVHYDFNIPDEYLMQVDYVKCFLESGEMTDNTVDFTTDDSITYSEGVDAISTFAYFDVNFPVDIKADGTEGAVANQHDTLTIFDPVTNLTKKVLTTSSERSLRVKYSPDGSKLAVATTQGCIDIYNTSDYDLPSITIYNGAVIQENVLFTNDSKYLIVGGFNGGSQAYDNPLTHSKTEKWCVRVFDVSNGAVTKEIAVGDDPRFITLTDDGTLMAVTTTSHGTYIYNTSDWSEYAHLEGNHKYAIRGADFSADGKLLVTSDEAGNIVIWDVESKSFVRKMNNVNTGSARRVLFSADGKNVLATSTYGAARLFDVESGEVVSLLGGFGNVIREIAYSPNGEFIVAASYDGGIKVFAKDGTYLRTLKAGEVDPDGEGYITSRIKFSPDSRYVFISTRTFPNALQKWALPTVVDKTRLDQCIAMRSPEDPGYDYAVKVAGLKYATEVMVADACSGLGFAATGYSLSAKVAGDNVPEAYADSVNTNRNRWFYFKTEAPAEYDVSVKIADKTTGESEFVELDAYNVIKSEFDASTGSVSRIIKLKIAEGGEYDVSLAASNAAVTFPSVTVNVDADKISYQNDFLYSVEGKQVTIVAGISGKQDVVIPDYIDGYPVTKIAACAFINYGSAISHMTLKLPSTLQRIEARAFSNCCSLRTVDLPKSLKYIDEYAFYSCRLLDNIVIPSGCTIKNNAFDRSGVGTLVVEKDTSISSSVFSNALRTRELIIGEGSTNVSINLGSQRLMEKVYVPASVTVINGTLFSSANHKVKLYGVPGTYAETYAAKYPAVYEFVPIAAPDVTGVAEGETYDIYTQSVSANWDNGPIAYLNGEVYTQGEPITEAGEYTLKVVNGYDEYSAEIHFTVIDTTPPPYTLGDVDDDSFITVNDALMALRFSVKLAVPVMYQDKAADVDLDGYITVSDALLILRVAAKVQDSF